MKSTFAVASLLNAKRLIRLCGLGTAWIGTENGSKSGNETAMCQVCIRKLYGTHRKYNYGGLQIHHAVAVNESEELRLDNSNLITLCYMCDNGEILYDEVKQIILEKRNCLRDNFHKTSQFKP